MRVAGMGMLLVAALMACPIQDCHAAGRTLRAFESEAQFAQLLAEWKAKAAEEQKRRSLASPPMPAPAESAYAGSPTTLDNIQVTGSRIDPADTESITNVQTSGVDEGDIVKKSGDYLVVLRRGRIFTIRIGSDHLVPVSVINAYAPDADPDGTWYDEMLIADGKVVVIGYSYERGGTEIGLFDLDRNGQLRYRDTYQMRSNDYYSARNYASRLIGHQLIFYSPLEIDTHDPALDRFIPALRHWYRGASPADFKRILPATRIYRGGGELELDEGVALHTVSICDLDAPTMQCQSTAVLGPEGRVFYVSEDAVYIWTTPWSTSPAKPNASAVFRIPLDGTAPTGMRTSGSPIDQMSFLQRDGFLNVLVGSEADGEGMWAANSRSGELALLRLPLDRFGDGSEIAGPSDYRALPGFNKGDVDLRNRYVGHWLLYGAGQSWGRTESPLAAQAVRFDTSAPVETIHLGHGVDRIDALGRDAIFVGEADDDLHFTSVRLGDHAQPVSGYVQRDANQGDDRSHGFFYKATDQEEGIVGLPTLRFEPHGDAQSSAVLYLRNRNLRLSRMGGLESRARPGADDGCKASCVDWYGNARPIFIGDRVFALLGYELVEGHIDGDRITERRRASFAPELAFLNATHL
jgi:hypothetical protein